MNKPIIGIVAKHYATYKSNKIDTFIRDEVKQAIFDNGAIAIGILASNEELIYCRDNWNEFGDILRKDDIINSLVEDGVEPTKANIVKVITTDFVQNFKDRITEFGNEMIAWQVRDVFKKRGE